MHDINSMTQEPNESMDEFVIRLFKAIDENWIEMKTKNSTESPVEHYRRYCAYENESWFKLHITNRRIWINESQNDLKNRKSEVKQTKAAIDSRAVNYVFNIITTIRDDENEEDHYNRIISFEETSSREFIFTKRISENDNNFYRRLTSYYQKRKNVIKAFDDMILRKMDRIPSDVKASDWFERCQKVIDQYKSFIMTPRILDFEKSVYESNDKILTRMLSYSNGLAKIEIEVVKEENGLQDQQYKKEAKLKHQAKAEWEKEQFEKELKKNKEERIKNTQFDNTLVVLFILFIFIVATTFAWAGFEIAIFMIIVLSVAFFIYKEFAKKKVVGEVGDETHKVNKIVLLIHGFFKFVKHVQDFTDFIRLTNIRR